MRRESGQLSSAEEDGYAILTTQTPDSRVTAREETMTFPPPPLAPVTTQGCLSPVGSPWPAFSRSSIYNLRLAGGRGVRWASADLRISTTRSTRPRVIRRCDDHLNLC